MTPDVQAFFDEDTFTLTYLVADPESRDAILIDPVLNYDVFSSQTSPTQADQILSVIETRGLTLHAILETHAHADHLSSAQYIKEKTQAPIGIGHAISIVQSTFKPIFNLPEEVKTDGSQFDILLEPHQPISFGNLDILPLATPGHTPACLSYLIGNAVFTGDALFMEDYGTGRTDFPAGSADVLYHSVHEVLYALPESTRVFVGHDYQPGGRSLKYESSIGQQKKSNVQLSAATSRDTFVALRTTRDKGLRAPRLIYQSVQVNVYGGLLPTPETGVQSFLKIPLNRRIPTNAHGTPFDR